ncbi:Histidine-containing phosphotransfer protein [Rhynchospora pubera]|uniref:Histidine-containing phosphotransfer protein n=1 Tax=Rhynchospora pubera TaxID=906938 RepID=A0AAV8BTE8_9POAL|nr:Histidine-containing phosphotransfer protein [Rhynchospora pubera]KAJ4800085.1 Histidine-containing phosphotransfer protein [Rhynchospora pubera]
MADVPLVTQPTDIKAQLKEERTRLVNSMFAEDLLDEQFRQWQNMECERRHSIVEVVISVYVEYAEKKISELARLLNEAVINVSKVSAYVFQLNVWVLKG